MNEAFMLLRRNRGIVEALPENSDDGMRSNWEAFVDRSPNPEESYLRRERTELLTEAINRLGPKVRTTMLLRDIEERTIRGGNGADSRHVNCRRESAGFSRASEVAPNRECWALSSSLQYARAEGQRR